MLGMGRRGNRRRCCSLVVRATINVSYVSIFSTLCWYISSKPSKICHKLSAYVARLMSFSSTNTLTAIWTEPSRVAVPIPFQIIAVRCKSNIYIISYRKHVYILSIVLESISTNADNC